jgi:hypothetical protein
MKILLYENIQSILTGLVGVTGLTGLTGLVCLPGLISKSKVDNIKGEYRS